VPFFEFLNDRRGADVQDAGGVANPTSIHGHRNDLLFDVRGLTGIGIITQKRATWARGLPTAIALLALRCLPMGPAGGNV
jgi:hypothetical protein